MFLAVDESLRGEGYGSAILKEIRNRYPEKKLIVSIEPCEDTSPDIEMGGLLHEELEEDYYVIGTDFYKTTCNLPRGRNGIRTNQTFYSYDPLAKAAKRAGLDICWLDFSKIPEDSSLKQYTADYIYNGSLGEGYNLIIRTIPMLYRVFDNPEMAYDSMIYVSEGTPTRIKQAK